MFIGKIDDVNDSYYNPILREVLKYLRTTDFSNMVEGAYPVTNNITAKLQRYETRQAEDCKPESHNKFVDVQFVAEGEELLGWCPISPDIQITETYNFAKDVTFYKSLIPESCVILSTRSFAILYPVDVHRPCCSVDEDNPSIVTKVVVKIPVELLK
ncbi:MAG: YhcH/YjgK/YiaL family protein [Selenomonadaceae bacterium]|nr:YhcH/YjgK/YiaL family protein [Selenomonadaceae bacterium]